MNNIINSIKKNKILLKNENLKLKIIFENLKQEQINYYKNILLKGTDTRKEGLIWCIKKLYEINMGEFVIEKNFFPNFLEKDEIKFLILIGKLSYESTQIKNVINSMKKKEIINNNNKNFEVNNIINNNDVKEIVKKMERKKNKDIIKKYLNKKNYFFGEKIKKNFEEIFIKNNDNNIEYISKQLDEFYINNLLSKIKKNFSLNNENNINNENNNIENNNNENNNNNNEINNNNNNNLFKLNHKEFFDFLNNKNKTNNLNNNNNEYFLKDLYELKKRIKLLDNTIINLRKDEYELFKDKYKFIKKNKEKYNNIQLIHNALFGNIFGKFKN